MYKKVITSLLAIFIAVASLPLNSAASAEDKKDSALGALVETISGTGQEAQFGFASEQEMLSGMSSVCSNDSFELFWSSENMAIAIVNKKTGEVFTSNPYDAASDPMCTGDVEKNLESQLIISYYDSEYKKQNMWSSSDCLEFGQYTAELYENGIAFELSLGEEKGEQLVPIAVEPAEFESYTEKLDSKQQRKLNAFYTLYAEGEFYDQEKLDKYPILAQKELYVLDGDLSDRERGELSEIFAAAGYTYEIYESSMEKLGIETEKLSFPNFKFRLEYLLTENGLDVKIPNDSIVCSDGYQLVEISVLPYFGCDKPESGKSGYLFIPDGSGALININGQQENRQTAIAGRIYGDNPVTDRTEELDEGKIYHLPVFGAVRNNGSAFAAVVTSGDVADYIAALLGGPNGRYYTVYNRFLYTEYEGSTTEPKLVSMGSTRQIYVSDKNRYTCDYEVSYSLLSGENANYAGMAAVYRDYIISKGMSDENTADNSDISIRTIGSALIDKDFLGIPYKTEVVFTSYEDNINILNDLKDHGIENISFSLRGWEKNGLDASVSNKVRFSSKLGGKRGYKRLAEYCSEHGISLTLGNEFVFSKYNRVFDGLGIKSSIAQTLEIDTAIIPEYRSFPELENNSIYIVSPSKYEAYAEKLFKESVKSGISGITVDSLGSNLVADYSSRHAVNRMQALEIIDSALKSGSESLILNFDGANAYVLPYASLIEDIPCGNSGIAGESASVPFLQMVISGSVNMNSEPINLDGDSDARLLDCIRCGVTPTYLVAADNIEKLKKTDYSRYFAVNYDFVSEDIVSDYEKISSALNAMRGARLTDSYEIVSGVYCSEFDNGNKIYTNYNASDYTGSNHTVPAGGFLVDAA